jgi:hypothetical protein
MYIEAIIKSWSSSKIHRMEKQIISTKIPLFTNLASILKILVNDILIRN